MRNYTKPSAEVVELAVKEPVSLTYKKGIKDFGFGSKTQSKRITFIQYAANGQSGASEITG